MHTCLNCERAEEQIPLLTLHFRGETIYLCPQCLPALIHKPEKMAARLPGIDTTKPVEHHH